MKAFLDAKNLWEAVEEDYEVGQLLESTTLNQIKYHKERKQRKSKAKSCLFSAIFQSIFTRIVTLKSAKAIWDFLKINQNLLSVGQLLDKSYKILFEDKMCLIKDASGHDLFKVKMKGKSFSLNLMEERDEREGSPVEINISFKSNSLIGR
uniref:Retrovirus-related Pol polyprotein from transposon TNT 1-94 n=1 Tax=Cajanus cajan TaxID=3821 RepID=A0A151R1V3_CAJCA|nr:hypothetical protein KK1_042383 [Cajanus cajan]